MPHKIDAQAVIDAFPYYVFLLDEDHKMYAANAAMLAFLKSNIADLHGQCCHTLVHGTEAPVCDCPLEKSKETGTYVEQQIDDPTLGWIVTAVYPMDAFTEDGKRLYVHVVRPMD